MKMIGWYKLFSLLNAGQVQHECKYEQVQHECKYEQVQPFNYLYQALITKWCKNILYVKRYYYSISISTKYTILLFFF